jgi:dihydroorotase
MTTGAPALVIGHDRTLGTLRPGAAADVTLMELREGPVTFEDTVGERVEGTRRLVPSGAVRAGRWVPPKAAH